MRSGRPSATWKHPHPGGYSRCHVQRRETRCIFYKLRSAPDLIALRPAVLVCPTCFLEQLGSAVPPPRRPRYGCRYALPSGIVRTVSSKAPLANNPFDTKDFYPVWCRDTRRSTCHLARCAPKTQRQPPLQTVCSEVSAHVVNPSSKPNRPAPRKTPSIKGSADVLAAQCKTFFQPVNRHPSQSRLPSRQKIKGP